MPVSNYFTFLKGYNCLMTLTRLLETHWVLKLCKTGKFSDVLGGYEMDTDQMSVPCLIGHTGSKSFECLFSYINCTPKVIPQCQFNTFMRNVSCSPISADTSTQINPPILVHFCFDFNDI